MDTLNKLRIAEGEFMEFGMNVMQYVVIPNACFLPSYIPQYHCDGYAKSRGGMLKMLLSTILCASQT
jgi:hypothetical protein